MFEANNFNLVVQLVIESPLQSCPSPPQQKLCSAEALLAHFQASDFHLDLCEGWYQSPR